ncbi:MAG: hypothetical protein QOJ84_2450 [Bradyrhizobium sp.]|nr:hypothetical protein [Bradyrhizobium sp.]
MNVTGPPKMFDVPQSSEFLGLFMDSDGVVEIQYKSPQKPEATCRLKFPLHAAPKLAGFLSALIQQAGEIEPPPSKRH